jgi:hypothetical protein
MDSMIRRLRIQTLKGQVAMCQVCGASLARRFGSEYLSDGQMVEIIRRRDESLEESFALQLMVDLLEMQEKKERENLD